MRALTLERIMPAVQNPLLAAICGSLCGVLVVVLAAMGSPMIAAGVMGGLLVAGAAVLFPDFAFLLVALAVPIERLGRFTNDNEVNAFSLMRIVGALALGSFLLHALIKRWKIKFGWAFIVYTAFAIWGAITVFFSNDRTGGLQTGGQVLGNLMFLFLTINIVRNWKLVKAGVVTWLIVVVLAGIWTIYGWHFQSAERAQGEANVGVTDRRFQATYVDNSTWDQLESLGRAQGTSSHPAVYGINLVFTLPFFFYFLRVTKKRLWQAVIAGSLVIVLYNIFLTNTRATFFVAAIIVFLCVLRQLYPLGPRQLIALLLIGAGGLYFVPEDVYTRVLDVNSYAKSSEEGSLFLRTQFWDAAYEVVQQNWLFGIGMGNQTAVPSKVNVVSPERISAHNEYLNTLMEVGIIGWVLFFVTVGIFLWSTFKAAAIFREIPNRHEEYWFMLACQISLIAALLYGVQVDVFHFPLKGWWLIAGLSVAMLWIAERDAREWRESVG